MRSASDQTEKPENNTEQESQSTQDEGRSRSSSKRTSTRKRTRSTSSRSAKKETAPKTAQEDQNEAASPPSEPKEEKSPPASSSRGRATQRKRATSTRKKSTSKKTAPKSGAQPSDAQPAESQQAPEPDASSSAGPEPQTTPEPQAASPDSTEQTAQETPAQETKSRSRSSRGRRGGRSRGGRGRSKSRSASQEAPSQSDAQDAAQSDSAATAEAKEAPTESAPQPSAAEPPSAQESAAQPDQAQQESALAGSQEASSGEEKPAEEKKSRSRSRGRRGGRNRGGRNRNKSRSSSPESQPSPETDAQEAAQPTQETAPEATPAIEAKAPDYTGQEAGQLVEETAAAEEDQAQSETQSKETDKSKRSSRSSRRRKKSNRSSRSDASEPISQPETKTEEAESQTQPRKAPLRMIFSEEAGYEVAAVAEGNRLLDFLLQEEEKVDTGKSGNIYRGVVSRVVPALNAAFVDIGIGKEGFLPFSDLGPEIYRQRQSGKKSKFETISDVLSQGDTVMVQLAKESIGDKGAALTTKISFPGRFVVFMPFVKVVRMSRQLDDGEKKKLSSIFEKQKDLEGGVIFRTAAKGQSEKDIQNDFNYLKKIWRKVQKDFKSGKTPTRLHKELDLFERMLRDHFHPDMSEIVVYHARLTKRINRFLNTIAPHRSNQEMVVVNPNPLQPVWKTYDLERDIDQIFSNIVKLDCGGYLIIEEMETLTAIDINSGGNIIKKNLDDTIYQTNLEAAQEVTRQLRLRQLGGIIIVDFIDMAHKRHQEQVFRTLERELEQDRTPSDIQQFTELGLIQITRQRTGQSLTKRLTFPCPHCQGSGRLPSLGLTEETQKELEQHED